MFKTIATKNFSYPLQKDMYYTKGARFTADKRLRYKAKLSNFCVAALSLYIIAISIGLLAYDGVLAGPLAKKLNALTIILSVAAFGYSLVMSASGYEVKASEMHACGMAINKLLKNLDATMSAGPVSPMFLQDIEEKYNLALEKCPNNHETIDYLRFKAECAHEIYGGNFFAIEFLSWRYSTGYYIDILLHICPMVLLATVPWIFIN